MKLRHVYGPSYFGSGMCYGHVYTCPNCKTEGRRDNGFVAGPDRVEVVDPEKPARFYARGGDAMNEGRFWYEAGEWIPGLGWQEVRLPIFGEDKPKEPRQAWLRETRIMTTYNVQIGDIITSIYGTGRVVRGAVTTIVDGVATCDNGEVYNLHDEDGEPYPFLVERPDATQIA